MSTAKLEEFVNTLSLELRVIYGIADLVVINSEDTASDEYNIAADIRGAFRKYAELTQGEPE